MKPRIYVPWTVNAGDLSALLAGPLRRAVTSFSVYGCLRGLTPSGRPNDIAASTRAELEALVRHCEKTGVATTYLLNGLGCSHSAWSTDLLHWLGKSLQPSAVCLTEPTLARKLVDIWPEVSIEISTIAGCLEPSRAATFLNDPKIRPHVKALCLHHDATSHNWQRTAAFASWLLKQRVDPFVLVNESCTASCPARESHYRLFGSRARMRCTKDFLDPFQVGCVLTRLMEPWTLLDMAGFLQPSMLTEFTKATGIRAFKLAGRSKPWEWVANAFRHYAAGQDPANIYEVVVFTVPFLNRWHMTSSDLFYVESKAYREVHMSLAGITDPTQRRELLKAAATRLYEDGQLRVRDPGSEYKVRDGSLVLTKPGEYASFLNTLRLKTVHPGQKVR